MWRCFTEKQYFCRHKKECTDETTLGFMAIADMDDYDSCSANLCGCRYGKQKTY